MLAEDGSIRFFASEDASDGDTTLGITSAYADSLAVSRW
jgi:hypothetical protein